MFQNLRVGTPLYVLHKNELKIETGEVTFVSQPVNQFGQVVFANSQPATVDISMQVDGKPIELKKIPATLTISDCGNNRVVSESREAISTELSVMKANSQRVIDSMDQHKEIVRKCDELLQELNPQIKQEAERSKEIESLANRVGGLESSIGRIEQMLTRSLETKK
jgi:hypothetical protein